MSEQEKRSPTELLVQVLEDFGEAEPSGVIVIWGAADGTLAWRTSLPLTHAVGMIETVKHLIFRDKYSHEN